MKKGAKLIWSLVIPQVVAAASGYFTVAGIGSWYQQLNKPSWNPPNWLFGPVWTLLYVLMGVALYLIWKQPEGRPGKRQAILLWGFQLFLNFWWSLIFFAAHETGWAFVELCVLWVSILATIIAFSRISKIAAWLLVPYISWVTFAGILNLTIWQLNR